MNKIFISITTIIILLNSFCLAQEISENNKSGIILGDEQLSSYLPTLKNKRIALLINNGSRVGATLLLDTLLKCKINIVKVFVPEHGLRGQADAGAKINDERDSETGIPLISLYGNNKKPSREQLSDIDIVVYDLQDVGVRFYTYISTLQYMMEACSEYNKMLIILDRPDPNGFYVDGPVLDSFSSFVGMQKIPVVYGMTCGEYAEMLTGEKWFNGAEKLKLKVVPCINYDHKKKYDLRYAPSPNLKTMAAVYLYPSLCFFEGTVVSLGRGTDKPFQQWGHPDFATRSNYSFTPESMPGASNPPYLGKRCWGVLVAENAKDALTKINNNISLKWLLLAYNWYPDKENFFNNFFYNLSGTDLLKKQVTQGMTEGEIHASWKKSLEVFKLVRKKYLIYKDFE